MGHTQPSAGDDGNAAPMTAGEAHACIVAVARRVIRRGDPETIARFLGSVERGCSVDTVERMLRTDDESRWTLARVLRLRSYEQTVLGSSTLAAVLSDTSDAMAPRPDAARAVTDGYAAGAAMARAAGVVIDALADQRYSPAERTAVIESCRLLIEQLPRFVAEVEADAKQGGMSCR